MKNGPNLAYSRKWQEICYILPAMTTTAGSYTIHTEARGPHWIAWLTVGAEAKPERSIILIAANQEQAEQRARQWAEARSSWGIG